MLLGSYKLKFSGKNRLVLPVKLRREIGERVVLTRGKEKCIWGFGKRDFERQAKVYLSLELESEEGRRLRREFFALAEEVSLDEQGRLVLPGALVRYAE